MKIGDTVKFKSSVVKRCGYDKTLANLRGKITGIFDRTCDVAFSDKARSLPLANIEVDMPIDNGFWTKR